MRCSQSRLRHNQGGNPLKTRAPIVQTNRASSVANPGGARAGNRKVPTGKMVAYAQTIARNKKTPLPEDYQEDFDACRRFLDEHAD